MKVTYSVTHCMGHIYYEQDMQTENICRRILRKISNQTA